MYMVHAPAGIIYKAFLNDKINGKKGCMIASLNHDIEALAQARELSYY